MTRMDWNAADLSETFVLFQQQMRLYFSVRNIKIDKQLNNLLLTLGANGPNKTESIKEMGSKLMRNVPLLIPIFFDAVCQTKYWNRLSELLKIHSTKLGKLVSTHTWQCYHYEPPLSLIKYPPQLNYALYASATCTCPSTCPSFTMGYKTIHVAHIHAQGGICMTISNNYYVVSISFVHHSNNINFHIIVLHSYKLSMKKNLANN